MSDTYTPRDYLHGQLGRSEEEAGLAVVAYARVSHEESAESGLSIPQQLDNIRAFCRQKGWEVIAEFKDEGASAYRESEDRPAFRQMIEFCLASQHTATPVRYIVVDKFDRPLQPRRLCQRLLQAHPSPLSRHSGHQRRRAL